MSLTNDDLQSISALLDPMKKEIAGINASLDPMKKEIAGINASLDPMKKGIAGINASLGPMKKEITDIKLTLENETNCNIKIIAEGHLDLNRKLNEALKVNSEKEMLLIRVTILENELRQIKERLKQMEKTA